MRRVELQALQDPPPPADVTLERLSDDEENVRQGQRT